MKCPHCQKHIASNRAVVVEHNGEPMSLRALALENGLPPATVVHRYQRGDRGDRLIRPADTRYSRRGRSHVGDE